MQKLHLVIRSIACLLLSASVLAQAPAPDAGQLENLARTDPDRILGMQVVSPEGAEMGELKGVIEDSEGRLFAAIVGTEDEESVMTIPLERLSLGEGGLVLGADRSEALSQTDDAGADGLETL